MPDQDRCERSAHVPGNPPAHPIADCGSCDDHATAQLLRQQVRALRRAPKKADVLGVLVAALAIFAVPNHAGTVQHRVAAGKSVSIPNRSRDILGFGWYIDTLMGRAGPTRIGREFGRRLRACRIAAGFENAADFADSLGLEGPTYRRYERGEAEPSFEILISMSRLTGKTIDFLLTGRKDQNEEHSAED